MIHNHADLPTLRPTDHAPVDHAPADYAPADLGAAEPEIAAADALPAGTCPDGAGPSAANLTSAKDFYDQRHAGLLRYLRGRVRPRQEADDLAQKTWAGFFRANGLHHPQPTALLYTIARRAYASWVGNEVPRAQRERYLEDLVVDLDHPVDEQWDSDIDPITVQLIRAELKSKLTDKQRLAVYLYYYLDLDYRGVAEIMNITTNGVKDHLDAAKRRLRRSPVMAQLHKSREGLHS